MAGSKYDLVVVGAGWFGLAAAKVYIELHPAEDVLVLEAESTCGGTWSAGRLYPGLKSNNLLDTYEYSDFPMSTEMYGVKPGQHIPGAVLHRYLTDFAKKFGVFARTRFNTKVDSLEPSKDGGWMVKTSSTTGDSGGEQTLETRRIIMATGLTSQPNFPSYPGAETFRAPYFHVKDFCRNGDTVKTAEQVVIVGGAKSAYDAAYAYVENGAHVDIVIRPSGKGPVWIAPPWVIGGKKRLEKLLTVRFLTWFSPCPFGDVDGFGWIRRFLHGTVVGRFLVDKFWANMGGEVLEMNGYSKHAELKKLQPRNSVFWTASGLSILNYDSDLLEMVRAGKISVHNADVERLTEKTVHLDNGTELNADILICATGWRKDPSVSFNNFGPAGISLPKTPAEKADLAKKADEQVLSMFPRLRSQPPLAFTPSTSEPFRLYRFMVPPARITDRNLAFAGLISCTSTALAANTQALWISAFFDGRLDHIASTEEEVTKEVMVNTQWGRWRFPCGYGPSLPDMAFETLGYVGTLLKDLNLKVCRKPTMWQELTYPYGPPDFAGLVDEWVNVHDSKAEK